MCVSNACVLIIQMRVNYACMLAIHCVKYTHDLIRVCVFVTILVFYSYMCI